MVLLENSALAELGENSQAAVSADQFYASLPREQQKSLLCCVCAEHNTTFRYEVIYKSTSFANQSRKKGLSTKSPESVVQQQVTLTTSVEDLEEQTESSHDYYNFPPRHPRHGHLKWPIWRPLVTPEESLIHESICITSTYPDYPVHLPTFTLKRVASVIKTTAERGRTRLLLT